MEQLNLSNGPSNKYIPDCTRMNTHFTDGATWISSSNCSTLGSFLIVQCTMPLDHPLEYACLTLRDSVIVFYSAYWHIYK